MTEAVKIRSIALWALFVCGVSFAANPTSDSTSRTEDSDPLAGLYLRLDKLSNEMARIIFLACSEGLNREEFDARFSRCVRNSLPKFEKLSHISGDIVRTYCSPSSVYLSNQKMCTCLNNLHNADLRLAGDSRPLHRHDGNCGQHKDAFSSIEEMQSALIRQTGIFGEDDRKEADLRDKRVYSVGSVECYDTSWAFKIGSAIVVRAKGEEEGDVILTAEHIFRNTETGEEYMGCHFRPGHNPRIKIPIDMGKIVYGGKFETKNEGDDWAVAGLEDTLLVFHENKKTEVKKKDLLAPLYSPFPLIGGPNSGMRLYEPLAGRPIELHGYNGDTQRMSVSGSCTIHSKRPYDLYYENDRLNIHDCDCIGGCSGGVLTTPNSRGQKVIVGIFVGDDFEEKPDHNTRDKSQTVKFDSRRNVNGAVVINRRILWVIENF